MSWNFTMNRLFNQDKSFFVTDKLVSELVEIVNICQTFGDVYTDVKWLNTSVVCHLT